MLLFNASRKVNVFFWQLSVKMSDNTNILFQSQMVNVNMYLRWTQLLFFFLLHCLRSTLPTSVTMCNWNTKLCLVHIHTVCIFWSKNILCFKTVIHLKKQMQNAYFFFRIVSCLTHYISWHNVYFLHLA